MPPTLIECNVMSLLLFFKEMTLLFILWVPYHYLKIIVFKTSAKAQNIHVILIKVQLAQHKIFWSKTTNEISKVSLNCSWASIQDNCHLISH